MMCAEPSSLPRPRGFDLDRAHSAAHAGRDTGRASRRGHGTTDDPLDGIDVPKTLSGLVLPPLSASSLCVASGLLLALILEGRGRPRPASLGCLRLERGANLADLRIHPYCIHQQSPSTSFLILLSSPKVMYPLLFIFTLAALLALQYRRLCRIVAHTSPVPGIEPVPDAHPYMGHYSHTLNLDAHPILFKEHATPSGLSAFWGPSLKRCASVLLAEHARLILRHNDRRDFSEWIIRHGKRTLGDDSLILINGGERWKRVRKVVARAFTNRMMKRGRRVVADCARECVAWLHVACEASEKRIGEDAEMSSCRGHGVTEEGKGTVRLEAKDFFKLYALRVFGRLAMDYDFRCLPAGKEGSSCTEARQKGPSDERGSENCTCLALPPEAEAFESLEADIGSRLLPTSFVDPAMQLYWIPTARNRAYRRNMERVSGLMGRIIGQELEARLGRDRLRERKSMRASELSVDTDDIVSCDSDKSDAGERSEENMVTHLLQSCLEQHFSRSASFRCPFASSMNSEASMASSSSSASAIPPPSQITQSDKDKITKDVTKILHTLLTAGYETTAISLSYVMYCLSRNPRCQERCHEEALRVLGKGNQREEVNDDDLPYCRAVLTESTRMHLPVLFTTRVLSKDLTLETGYDENDAKGNPEGRAARATLLKGTRVYVNPTIMHRDERNFERASDFVPERWVRWDDARGQWVERNYEEESKRGATEKNDAAESNKRADARLPKTSTSPEYNATLSGISAANPANYFSFSDGARNCVGKRLAVMESTILIAVLLRDVNVSLGEEDFELEKERSFVTVSPKKMPIVFSRR